MMSSMIKRAEGGKCAESNIPKGSGEEGCELKHPIPRSAHPSDHSLSQTWSQLLQTIHRAKPHLAQLHKRNWTSPMCTDSVTMLKTWKETLQSSHHHQHMVMGKHCGKASSAWPSPWASLWGKVLLSKCVLFGLRSSSDKKVKSIIQK